MKVAMKLSSAAILVLLALSSSGILACNSSGTGSTECLLDTLCVDDSDCENGTRCNLATTPPACALLYCGAEGTPCNDDGLCAPDHLCTEGVCVAQATDATTETETDTTDAASGCIVGATTPCSIPGVAGCNGTMVCGVSGVFGPCNVPAEDCGTAGTGNGIDDNCDGVIDEGCTLSDENDCLTPNSQEACLTSCQSVGSRKCGADKKWGACIPPIEECNGKDDNCNGVPDDGISRQCETDCGKGTEVCSNGVWSSCTAPQPQDEVCDGKDNDCNGVPDDAPGGCP